MNPALTESNHQSKAALQVLLNSEASVDEMEELRRLSLHQERHVKFETNQSKQNDDDENDEDLNDHIIESYQNEDTVKQ